MSEKRNTAALMPLSLVLFGSWLTLINSIGKEPWRVIFASIAFIGVLGMWILFYRQLKKKDHRKTETGK
jgi:hypothetical protein